MRKGSLIIKAKTGIITSVIRGRVAQLASSASLTWKRSGVQIPPHPPALNVLKFHYILGRFFACITLLKLLLLICYMC